MAILNPILAGQNLLLNIDVQELKPLKKKPLQMKL